MRIRLLLPVTLLVLTAFSTQALAETPARVGRIALAEGQVTISSDSSDEAEAALINWPVTSNNQISTGRGARTEIRIGSTSVRLDASSALDVVELDDDSLRLHLHYGSASVRVRNAEVVRGFELTTPQGRVSLREPGRLRIDAERAQDTTVVHVFEGVATVDGGGSNLTVRPGKRLEIIQDDVRTGLASSDAFDEWALLRDRRDERVTSDRYVTREMTGYEELDQYGVWRDDSEYGPLWSPRSLPLDWAPYRDGRWTHVAPWGWTWVDNAPWGYAPSHYGRWVMVNQRWCWAPGRDVGRPIWAPALVGWVGGSGWSLSFNSGGSRRHAPAQGWYPLSPRDTYAPSYRVSHDHLRYINRVVSRVPGRDGRRDGDRHDRRHGLTVVPHDHFGQRGQIVVRSAPRADLTALAIRGAPEATAPPVRERTGERRRGRGEYDVDLRGPVPQDRGGDIGSSRERERQRGQRDAAPVMTAPVTGTPVATGRPAVLPGMRSPAEMQRRPERDERENNRDNRDWRAERDARFGDNERRVRIVQPVAVTPSAPVINAAPQQQPQQQQQQPQQQQPQRAPDDRWNRPYQGDGGQERRQRDPAFARPQQQQPQQQQPQQQQPLAQPRPSPIQPQFSRPAEAPVQQQPVQAPPPPPPPRQAPPPPPPAAAAPAQSAQEVPAHQRHDRRNPNLPREHNR